MKKFAFLSALIVFFVASCKKDSGSQTSVSPANSSTVSDALKIWHGINVKGSVTGNNNGVLSIDPTPLQIQSYKGGYAVITPTVLSGTIAGYYIHVNGADSYFNVNFSNAVSRPAISSTTARPGIGGSPIPGQHKKPAFLFRPTTDSSTYADSAIVIQLPSNIDTGTFCMEYWAYDDNNDISDSVSVCVTIDQLGSSDGSSLTGSWVLSGYQFPVDSGSVATMDTSWHYNIADSTNILDYQTGFYCVDGYVSQDSGYYNDPVNGTIAGGSSNSESIPEYLWFKSFNLVLSANGAYLATAEEVNKQFQASLDSQLVQCSAIPYVRDDEQYTTTGGWSYNTTTNKFIIVEKDSGQSAEGTFVEEYNVQQRTNSQFVLISNQADEASLRFTKQ